MTFVAREKPKEEVGAIHAELEKLAAAWKKSMKAFEPRPNPVSTDMSTPSYGAFHTEWEHFTFPCRFTTDGVTMDALEALPASTLHLDPLINAEEEEQEDRASRISSGRGSDDEEPDPSTSAPAAKRRKKNTLDLSEVPMNLPPIPSDRPGSASRFKGVYKDGKKWRAQIKIPTEGGIISLGTFDSEEEAGIMYARARSKYPVGESEPCMPPGFE